MVLFLADCCDNSNLFSKKLSENLERPNIEFSCPAAEAKYPQFNEIEPTIRHKAFAGQLQ